ncbi:MAG: ATP-binding protein [bacterium]|nr:ATP-binding protein [bacterium]
MTLELLYKTEITEQDLLSLIGTTSEGQYIDFKKDAYNSQNPKWQRSLCEDVTAFANADGGIIVCGMDEKNGYADDLCGLGQINPDAEKSRLKQTISSNTEPSIYPEVIDIQLSDSQKGFALVIRIPRSVYQPHRSEIDPKRFTIRRSNGNGDMTVEELRRAFNLSATFIEKANQIRVERIARISEGKTPYPVPEGFKVALHVIPFSALGLGQRIDLSYLGNIRDISNIPQWARSLGFYEGKHNQRGFASEITSDSPYDPLYGYTHIFRTGIIETVFYFYKGEYKFVGLYRIEAKLLHFVEQASTIFQNLYVNPPFIVMVSLLDTVDYRAHPLDYANDYQISTLEMYNKIYTFEDNQVLLDDIVLEQFTDNYGVALRPLFDELYNMAGHNRSPNYDNDGNWIAPKKP